jgi:predicted AAA+ superfamily ATPase
MKYIDRLLYNKIPELIKPNKVLIIYGPRRVGKTFILNKFLSEYKYKYLFVTGDDRVTRRLLENRNLSEIKSFIGNNDLFVIDEAQKVKNIGEILKLIVDQIPQIKVIATGSSSFDLSNKVGEPLTGRSITEVLYPVSQIELKNQISYLETVSSLEERLIYGSYPEVITLDTIDSKRSYLIELTDSYLLKDLMDLENTKSSNLLIDLLILIAFQIGKEVSLQELGNRLNISKNTVSRYLFLLEKAFVIINIRGYSSNLRKEVTQNSRYYFYDNGIRNALIRNFNPISLRDDIGQLWENFLFIERLKKQEYLNIYSNNYFWRTYDKKEIDLVESREGKLFGYEFKYSKSTIPTATSKEWLSTYPNSSLNVVTKENYLDFIT